MTAPSILRLLGAAALGLLLAGCETPRTRALAHAAAFEKLSAEDRRLVLAGRVHAGMKAAAVYIAWGEPDSKGVADTGKNADEHWIYLRQLTVKAPLGSFDQWSPGTSLFGPTVQLEANPGFGFGAIGNEGGLLFQPHLQIADNTVKEADFVGGILVRSRMSSSRLTLPR